MGRHRAGVQHEQHGPADHDAGERGARLGQPAHRTAVVAALVRVGAGDQRLRRQGAEQGLLPPLAPALPRVEHHQDHVHPGHQTQVEQPEPGQPVGGAARPQDQLDHRDEADPDDDQVQLRGAPGRERAAALGRECEVALASDHHPERGLQQHRERAVVGDDAAPAGDVPGCVPEACDRQREVGYEVHQEVGGRGAAHAADPGQHEQHRRDAEDQVSYTAPVVRGGQQVVRALLGAQALASLGRGQQQVAPVVPHDVERAAGPAVLLLEERGQVERPEADREDAGEVDGAPLPGHPDGRGEVLGDRTGRDAADGVDRLGPHQEVRAADERGVVRGLAGAQQPVEERLLVVRPARHRVGAVAVELAGLDPAHLRVVEPRDELEEEVAARDLIGVEDAEQHVAVGADDLPGVVDVARLGSAAHLAHHVDDAERLAQGRDLRHRGLLGHEPVVADHDGDLGIRVLLQVGVPGRHDAGEGGAQHLFALVHGGYEHIYRIAERVDPLLRRHVPAAVVGLGVGRGIARPQPDVQAHGVDGGVHLGDVEGDADDPAGQRMPAYRDDGEPPGQVVDTAGEHREEEGDIAQLAPAPAGHPGQAETEGEGRGGQPRSRTLDRDHDGDGDQAEPAEPARPGAHLGRRRGDRVREPREGPGVHVHMPAQQRFRAWTILKYGQSPSPTLRTGVPAPLGVTRGDPARPPCRPVRGENNRLLARLHAPNGSGVYPRSVNNRQNRVWFSSRWVNTRSRCATTRSVSRTRSPLSKRPSQDRVKGQAAVPARHSRSLILEFVS